MASLLTNMAFNDSPFVSEIIHLSLKRDGNIVVQKIKENKNSLSKNDKKIIAELALMYFSPSVVLEIKTLGFNKEISNALSSLSATNSYPASYENIIKEKKIDKLFNVFETYRQKRNYISAMYTLEVLRYYAAPPPDDLKIKELLRFSSYQLLKSLITSKTTPFVETQPFLNFSKTLSSDHWEFFFNAVEKDLKENQDRGMYMSKETETSVEQYITKMMIETNVSVIKSLKSSKTNKKM